MGLFFFDLVLSRTAMEDDQKKKHRAPKAGTKAEKKKAKKQDQRNPSTVESGRARNPKAFTFQSTDKAIKKERKQLDGDIRRTKMPLKHRSTTPSTITENVPPVIIFVVGPPGVGKTTLIQSMIRHYSRQTIVDPIGPITVVSGKKRRLTFFECQNDLNSMIDCAKVSDLVLLVIDGHFGFEMETFEYLNILQVHGFPRVMGVLTHLDKIKSGKNLRKTKKRLKHRFQTEIYPGAKLFYFSGIQNGKYPKLQVHNLARFISVMKFKPLKWQNSHPYLIADRMEDLTHPQKIQDDPAVSRRIVMYGYLRGTRLKPGSKVHIPGCDDFWLEDVTEMADPCPLPDSAAVRRSLSEKQRQLYAPFSNVSNIALDKDATYIEIPDHKVVFTRGEDEEDEEDLALGEQMVRTMQGAGEGIDEKLKNSQISLFSYSAPVSDTRNRRPMVFQDEVGDEEDKMDENDEDSSDDDDDQDFLRPRVGGLQGGDDEEEEEEDDEDFFTQASSGNTAGGWFDKVAALYKSKGKNLMDVVYGIRAVTQDGDDKQDEQDNDELLRLVVDKRKESSANVNRIDSSKLQITEDDYTNWEDADALEKLQSRFADAAWFDDVDHTLVNDSDEELYGDFEDLEAKEDGDMGGDDDDEEDDGNDEDDDDDIDDEKMERLKQKEALKAKFNAEYDDDEDEAGYLDDLKNQADEQERLNREEFAQDDPALRAQLIGFESGCYIRIQISGVPCEFVERFNPRVPLVMGGLLPNEQNMGFIQTRVKRHRWHRKILKTNDPLIISMGWRRFQTLPLFSLADDALRHRMLKYTPEHMHCFATFYGPVTPPNTGFMGFQKLDGEVSTFRVAATGVVLEVDQSFQIVKKLKLTGVPFKTFKNTAFIKNMFNSELEVAKFTGAAIRTVSGVRGQIKKPLKTPGTYRATFEDKILMSDIVFLRTWYPVHPQKFYNPVTSLLDADWQGMGTVFELRKDRGLKIPVSQDSLYKPIEREERKFNPLRIPKSLEKELPYATKQKSLPKKQSQIDRPVLIGYQNKKDKQVDQLLQQLGTLKNDKIRKAKEKKKESLAKRAKHVQAEREKLEKKAKESRRRVFRMQGIEEEHAKKKRKYGSKDD